MLHIILFLCMLKVKYYTCMRFKGFHLGIPRSSHARLPASHRWIFLLFFLLFTVAVFTYRYFPFVAIMMLFWCYLLQPSTFWTNVVRQCPEKNPQMQPILTPSRSSIARVLQSRTISRLNSHCWQAQHLDWVLDVPWMNPWFDLIPDLQLKSKQKKLIFTLSSKFQLWSFP